MVLGGRVSGRCLGHEGEALLNGIRALIKETLRDHSLLLPCEDSARIHQLSTRKRDLRRKRPCWHLDLQLLASGTVRTDAFRNTLVCRILLEQSEWTKTVE